jgi:excinuclease UvrABC ATPase subunit
MDAETGNALPIPEPNTFSFNSPKGSCPLCKGLGNQWCRATGFPFVSVFDLQASLS